MHRWNSSRYTIYIYTCKVNNNKNGNVLLFILFSVYCFFFFFLPALPTQLLVFSLSLLYPHSIISSNIYIDYIDIPYIYNTQ